MIVIRGITNVHGDIEIGVYKPIHARHKEFDEQKRCTTTTITYTHSEIYKYVRVCLFISNAELIRGEMPSEQDKFTRKVCLSQAKQSKGKRRNAYTVWLERFVYLFIISLRLV